MLRSLRQEGRMEMIRRRVVVRETVKEPSTQWRVRERQEKIQRERDHKRNRGTGYYIQRVRESTGEREEV